MEAKAEGIQSVQRSFALLEALSQIPQGTTIKELSDTLGLPKSTVHRLLQNLAGLGYVLQDENTARYRATLKMFEVGSDVVGQLDAVSFARPHLDSLAAQTGETVHLVVRDGPDVVYVYKAESGSMRMSSRLGLRIPMYCTGVGKAILSTLSYAEVDRIWQQSEIHPITDKTITDFKQLEKQLSVARQCGWAMDDEENEPGIRCVAVPLPALPGTPSTAFSISGTLPRMEQDHLLELANLCLATRQKIAHDMGLGKR